ncbi:MAG: YeeE/YedE family protein [Burkholderiales bacterium]|nr:YeeE/YedE family protein [Burkholderiales bacterium]
MSLCTSFAIGLIFGLGLLISGMSNPAKVLTFLDIAGRWEPTLMIVMIGAISIASIGFALAKKRSHSLLKLPIYLPQQSAVDKRLIGGSVIFGIGWGIAGICPGPAIVLLGASAPQALWFVAAMALGMLIFELFSRWQVRRALQRDASQR